MSASSILMYGFHQFMNETRDMFAGQDSSSMARLNAKYDPFGNAAARLWGKAIPTTWGKRRILGQPIQVGKHKVDTSVNFEYSQGSTQGYGTVHEMRTNHETVVETTIAYTFGAGGHTTRKPFVAKLWFNGTLVYDFTQALVSPAVQFKFYTGEETQLPDGLLNEDRYDYPVAYRGLMSIVFYNWRRKLYPGVTEIFPTVQAEIWEQYSNSQPVTTYVTGTSAQFGSISMVYSAKNNVFYNVGNDGHIYKFDATTRTLIERYPVAPLPHAGDDTFNPNEHIYGHALTLVRSNGINYLVTQASLRNSQAIYVIEADTGAYVSHLGVTSNSLSHTPINYAYIKNGATINENNEGLNSSSILLGLTLIDNRFVTLKFANGILTFVNSFDNYTSLDGSKFVKTATGLQQLIWHGNKIDQLVGNVRVTDWYTGTHEIVSILGTPADNHIVIFETDIGAELWRIYKLNPITKVIAWELNETNNPNVKPPFDGNALRWTHSSNTMGQSIAWTPPADSQVYRLDMLSGQIEIIPKTASHSSSVDPVWDSYSGTLIYSSATSIQSFDVLNPTSNRMPLSELLRDLAMLYGYTSGNIVVTGIGDTITGAAITNKANVGAILTDISVAYNFTIKESGGKIYMNRRARGAGFVADGTLVEADRAILSEDDGAYITVRSERAPDSNVPGTVAITYIDPDMDYNPVTVQRTRNDDSAQSGTTQNLALPIIMTNAEATTLAARMILDVASGRMSHEFLLPSKYYRVEPGDFWELDLSEYRDTVKLIEVNYNGDHSLSIKSEVVITDIGPSVEADEYVLPDELPMQMSGTTQTVVFDTPLLQYTDQQELNLLESYVGVIPSSREGLRTGVVAKVLGAGAIAPVALAGPLTYGRLDEPLVDAAPWQFDHEATLAVRLTKGSTASFEDHTAEEVLAGANRILVGAPGRWEFLGFTTAVASGSRVVLTGLIRGLRGTEMHTGSHLLSDMVVLYREGISMDLTGVDALGQTATYYTQGPYGNIDYSDPVSDTVEGDARKPWSVSNVHVKDVSGDLNLTWHRRTRLIGPLNNGNPDVPLDESSERYEVDIYRSGSIVRTVSGLTSPAFTYTASMQTADGWASPITSLRLDIYQMSAIVGRGFVKTGVYDVE